MMDSGFGGRGGRGGRGAALMEALNKSLRRPGEQDENTAQTAQPTSKVETPGPVPAAMGRGALLSGLLTAGRGQPIQIQQPRATGRGVAEMQALVFAGRGRGMMPQVATPPLAAKPEPVAQPVAQPSAAAPTYMAPPKPTTPPAVPLTTSPTPAAPSTPSPTPTAPSTPSPTPTAPSGSSPPSSRFGRMALDREEVVHRMGETGKRTALSGNYIRIKCLNPGVYQYHVDFRPQIDSKNMRFRMVTDQKDIIGTTKAFDGSILYLPRKLPDQETICHAKRITDGTDITIIIRLTKVVPPEACVPLYNIIFRRIMKILEMVQVGRYYYNPATPSTVPQHKLEVWPGYITAVSENEDGLMLLADASHRVLRTETVYKMLQNMVEKNPQGFRDDCVRALIGTVVLTRYNNKTYRIDDILWDKTPNHKFTSSSSGEEMSFVDYYMKAYQKRISDVEQPLLLHRPKQRQIPGGKESKSEAICLIPELCYLTGLTDELRQDFRVMKDIACHTRVTPAQRHITMRKFIDSVNKNPEAKRELDNWGLKLDEETIHIDGRVLDVETINFGKNRKVSATGSADWGRDATRQNVITAIPIKNWIVVYTKRDQSKASDFIKMMINCCPQMGIDIEPPHRFELHDDRTETVIRSLRDNINPSVQLVVIICPTSRDDRYSAIKKLCCKECPVPSQVIIGKTISKPDKLRSVTQKVALQINCKLGGELWSVHIPMKKLMVVGIDVYHDAANKSRSIAGFVASMNSECTRWYSRVCFQLPGQELVDGLKLCLISAIRKYHEVNHVFPEKIVVFRDGVGDGQLRVVKGHEVPQLMNCFSQFGADYQPKLSVIIVQKRINARIFQKGGRGMENPAPGTVVDHTITRREWYDFFLVSQHVRQGTVSPTHYIVVHDGTGMKPDHMQRLAYKMTHLYYNWPGTVRVPAPCQYAHKLAYLVGQNIKKEPAPELSDRLFFL